MTTAIRLARVLSTAGLLALLLPGAAVAAPPEHAPAETVPFTLPGGDFCAHDVTLSNPAFKAKDTFYGPLPDGTARIRSRGMTASQATDETTGASVFRRGGSSITYAFAADGSLVATATGLFFAWYLPGDDSDLGPGLWLVNGRAREVYDSEGNFVSATFTGTAIDVCEALEG
jgi:hypothetical protein